MRHSHLTATIEQLRQLYEIAPGCVFTIGIEKDKDGVEHFKILSHFNHIAYEVCGLNVDHDIVLPDGDKAVIFYICDKVFHRFVKIAADDLLCYIYQRVRRLSGADWIYKDEQHLNRWDLSGGHYVFTRRQLRHM